MAAAGLVAILIWHRSRIRSKQLLPSLPQELVDIIISYLACDTHSLLACSMTCRSWYIAAVPHLHRSLTTFNQHRPDPRNEKYLWPRPLEESYKLGLLQFVKQLTICQKDVDFTPKCLDGSTFHYFSLLKNLQVLYIEELDLSSFMPHVQKYLGHFAPSLQDFRLGRPRGSCHQLLYFVGLFPNLQHLHLEDLRFIKEEETAANLSLIFPSPPPLRGRLLLWLYDGEMLIKGMINSFGGLRFRHACLRLVRFPRLVLEACANTLEVLRLNPSGEDLSQGGIALC